MLSLEDVRAVHSRDMAEILNRLRLASDGEWQAETPCAGWTVADLAAHLASIEALGADALERMRAGVPDPPPMPTLTGDRTTVIAALEHHAGRVESALAALAPQDLDKAVPMPAGPVPLPVVLQVYAVEAGVHAQDVQMAMSGRGVLPPDVIEAVAALLPGVLRRGEEPPAGTAYRLVGTTVDVSYTWQDGEWQHEPAVDDAACVIEGDDNTVLLFAFGRIGADDPGLHVSDLEAARRFKAFLPGP
jgi:uncharacterized protein (TIGR03083 family)